MASVERAMAKAASGLLPGLLPTPSVAPCLIILPSYFASEPKPGRADSVGRWDAHKKPRSPASSCGSSSSGRASSCERWDMNKTVARISSSTSSSSRGSSSSSSSSTDRWDSSKRPPSRASSTDRWDTHKKARFLAQEDAESRTGEEEEQGINDKQPRMDHLFSGSSFFASPDPSMLPMPTFFRSRGSCMMPGMASNLVCS